MEHQLEVCRIVGSVVVPIDFVVCPREDHRIPVTCRGYRSWTSGPGLGDRNAVPVYGVRAVLGLGEDPDVEVSRAEDQLEPEVPAQADNAAVNGTVPAQPPVTDKDGEPNATTAVKVSAAIPERE